MGGKLENFTVLIYAIIFITLSIFEGEMGQTKPPRTQIGGKLGNMNFPIAAKKLTKIFIFEGKVSHAKPTRPQVGGKWILRHKAKNERGFSFLKGKWAKRNHRAHK